MGGGGGVGPAVRSFGVSCVSWQVIAVFSESLLAETWTYQQEVIGMVNLGDRVVAHFELKSVATYVW